MKTIGIDTNVLLAFRLKRKPGFRRANTLFEESKQGKAIIYIPEPVILETEWVLRSFYKQPKEKTVEFFEELLIIENVFTTNKPNILFALNLYKYSRSVSFADCVITTQIKNQGVDQFLTFDANLSKFYQSLV